MIMRPRDRSTQPLWRRLHARLVQPLRPHSTALALFTLIGALAFIRLTVDPMPRTPLVFNWTPSLPYRVAWVRYGRYPVRRGDYVLYVFTGPAQRRYPGLRRQPFFKQIAGLPGDVITVERRWVRINGHAVGYAKTHTLDGHPLRPIAAMTIPPGFVYAHGSHPDSFDSRYQASGLVRIEQIAGQVYPVW